jgi:hypothetical protein
MRLIVAFPKDTKSSLHLGYSTTMQQVNSIIIFTISVIVSYNQ